jgi:hypothetical protein
MSNVIGIKALSEKREEVYKTLLEAFLPSSILSQKRIFINFMEDIIRSIKNIVYIKFYKDNPPFKW